MPRIQFSDVVPPEKRTIRNIPIPSGGRRRAPVAKKPVEEAPQEDGEFSKPPAKGRRRGKGGRRWIFIIVAIALLMSFIVGMMTVFASATVRITPKSENVAVSMKVTGSNEPTDGAVRYEVIKMSKSETMSVPATGEEMVELKASGKIVIYNNFSTDPQRLIIRTRFESSEGLVYRIPESVVVPGKTVKNGVETPGSIEVQVFADEAGEKYNIKKTDFTVPGFKNDAVRYKNIYARSSTDMSGGFIGKMKKVAEADKQEALGKIETNLRNALQKDLQTKVPEELVFLADSIIYESRELTQKEEGSSAVLGKEMTAYAIMLNKEDLSRNVAVEYVPKSDEWSAIRPVISDFSGLKMASKPGSSDISGKINLQIEGSTNVLAFIDTEAIGKRLLGNPKGEAAKMLDEFAGISTMTATIRPLWKRSFPKSPEKLYVQTVGE